MVFKFNQENVTLKEDESIVQMGSINKRVLKGNKEACTK